MANWCDTSIAFYSRDRQLLTDFHDDIVTVTAKDNWLGNMLKYYGFDPENYSCRSHIYYISNVSLDADDVWYFILDQEDAWSPHTDPWDDIVSIANGDIDFVYKSEEPGQDIFVNSDIEGWYFKERYVIDASLLDTEDKIYTQTESETISLCRYILKDRSINSISQARAIASKLITQEKGEWFRIDEFEEV